jgi:4-hydroxybenzoate polyprenyltransferase/phosphoserine phosphatase
LVLNPLVVDLDGTLIKTDMLHESALDAIKKNPFVVAAIPLYLLKGKAYLKEKLAQGFDFDAKTLPYNTELLGWLHTQKCAGRRLILCTASDKLIANSIATHLGIFDEVIASDGRTNVAGVEKAKKLQRHFKGSNFDYAGNSRADLSVWSISAHAVVVNASEKLTADAKAICDIERIFPAEPRGIGAWRRMLRIHQWLKNLLLLVPLFAGHQVANFQAWFALMLAILSFSLCASSVYIANDLLDLSSDRFHRSKRHRPFASGLIPVWVGVMLAPLLLVASLSLGNFVGGSFLNWLIGYFVVTCIYSWTLKRLIIIDCLTLAVLYTFRIVAGASAIDNSLSFWLLAFSIFLFLSLAFVKRYAELETQLISGKEQVHGRGYLTSDASLVQTMGISSGYAAVLVLALYLNSDAIIKLYRAPQFIWGAVPVMLFWINWMWMQAHRGKMHDDPLIFAIKDKASLLTGIVFSTILIVGTVGLG